jgi:hypothetical protein
MHQTAYTESAERLACGISNKRYVRSPTQLRRDICMLITVPYVGSHNNNVSSAELYRVLPVQALGDRLTIERSMKPLRRSLFTARLLALQTVGFSRHKRVICHD